MITVRPTIINDSNLSSSSVAIDDAPAWMAGSYDTSDQVVFNFRVYEALTTTTDQPDIGALADPPTWLGLGAVNRYRMFDLIVGSASSNMGSIDVTLNTGTLINAVALFGLSAASVRVAVDDAVDGVVYDETVDLVDNSTISGWFDYVFEPVNDRRTSLVFLDLPQYAGADVQIFIDNGIAEAVCGECVVGQQRELGVSNFGTTVGIQSFSRKERDQFGNFIIVPRRFAKLVDYDVTFETARLGVIQRTLAAIRDEPVVYIGDPLRDETIVLGFLRDFRIPIEAPSISTGLIEVEGLNE